MSLGKEIIEMIREEKLKREDRVLQQIRTSQPRRQIFELACKHFRDGGRVRANGRLCRDKGKWR